MLLCGHDQKAKENKHSQPEPIEDISDSNHSLSPSPTSTFPEYQWPHLTPYPFRPGLVRSHCCLLSLVPAAGYYPQSCVVTRIVFLIILSQGVILLTSGVFMYLCYTDTSFSVPQSAILIHTVSFLVEGRCEPPVTSAGNRSCSL